MPEYPGAHTQSEIELALASDIVFARHARHTLPFGAEYLPVVCKMAQN